MVSIRPRVPTATSRGARAMAALGDRVMVAVEHALERVSHMPQMLDLLSKIRLVVVVAIGKVGPGGGWRLRRVR